MNIDLRLINDALTYEELPRYFNTNDYDLDFTMPYSQIDHLLLSTDTKIFDSSDFITKGKSTTLMI